jgi:hypothetical protein
VRGESRVMVAPEDNDCKVTVALRVGGMEDVRQGGVEDTRVSTVSLGGAHGWRSTTGIQRCT